MFFVFVGISSKIEQLSRLDDGGEDLDFLNSYE